MNTAKVITAERHVRDFVVVDRAGAPVCLNPVNSEYTVLGMTEDRSNELSRAMLKAIETIDPRKQRFVKA